jgi:hypothetical protein
MALSGAILTISMFSKFLQFLLIFSYQIKTLHSGFSGVCKKIKKYLSARWEKRFL